MNKKIILLTLLLLSFFLRNDVFAADKSNSPTTCINSNYYNNTIASWSWYNDCQWLNSNPSLLAKLKNSWIISWTSLTSIWRAIAWTDAAKCWRDCISKIINAVCADWKKRTSTTSWCVDICDTKTQTYDTTTQSCKTKLVCPTGSTWTYPSCTCSVSSKIYNSTKNICECPTETPVLENWVCIAKTAESTTVKSASTTTLNTSWNPLTPWNEWWSRRNSDNNVDFSTWYYSSTKYFNAKWTSDWKWAQNLILNIARDLRLIIFWILWLVILYMSLQLFISDKTEDQVKKYRKWIMWASIWIVVMQMAFMIWSISEFDNINAELWKDVTNTLILPFQRLMTLWASALFIFTWIRAFYRMVTAWSNEKANEWKKAIWFAIVGFIIIKIADFLVKNTFSPTCSTWNYNIVWSWVKICGEVKKHTELIVSILSKINLYVWIFVILSIIYTWFLIVTSNWDDDKKKKAKSNITNMVIWIVILFASYLIMTFFINKA